MPSFYVLDDNRHVVGATREQWEVFPDERALVAETRLPGNGATITTFFAGAVPERDVPLYPFATTSQVEKDWVETARYSTWQEAELGHERIVARMLA